MQGLTKHLPRQDLILDIAMSALDADVIKTYVELGLGVGLVASMAFNPARDIRLNLLDSSHLFQKNTTNISVRRGHYLRGYAYRFIELCLPSLTEAAIRFGVKPEADVELDNGAAAVDTSRAHFRHCRF